MGGLDHHPDEYLSVSLILWACQHDTQGVYCMRRDDNKLSLLASTDLFHPITGTCHVTVLSPCGCFLCVVCFLLFLLFGSLCFGSFSLERDKGIGLVSVLYQLTFAALQLGPLRELIN